MILNTPDRTGGRGISTGKKGEKIHEKTEKKQAGTKKQYCYACGSTDHKKPECNATYEVKEKYKKDHPWPKPGQTVRLRT